MPSEDAAAALVAALDLLAEEVEALTYPTPTELQAQRIARRDRTTWIIREHLLRRLADLDGALRVVVVGPTGSGASTLLNSMAGMTISEAGPLRPTTKVPVVWCDPRLEPEFAFDFLTGFGTATEAIRPLRVVAHRHQLVESLALVDAPDFDSTEVEHRATAELLVDAADLCLLVVSRHRYADAAVWDFLDHIAQRPVKVGAVMNRTERGDGPAVADFEERLKVAGFDDKVVAVLDEQSLVDGRLATDALEPIQAWLEAQANPEDKRKQVMDELSSTLEGLFGHLDALDSARAADLDEGRVLRDLAREVAEQRASIVRDRMPKLVTLSDAEALIQRELGEVQRWTAEAWGRLDGGKKLVEQLDDLEVPDAGEVVAGDRLGDARLADSVREVFNRFGLAAAALAPEPAEIDGLERAAALVMQAGRRFLDA